MPTGIAQDRHLSRIASTMRHVEKSLEIKFLDQRNHRPPIPLGDRQPRPEQALADKKTPSSRAAHENTRRASSGRLLPKSSSDDKRSEKEAFQDREDLKETVFKGNDGLTGGLIAIAVRKALIEEGIPVRELPAIKTDAFIKPTHGIYSFESNSIVISKPMMAAAPLGDISLRDARKRIRFSIAFFSMTLIHESRHFEQWYKAKRYWAASDEARRILAEDYRKWFIAYFCKDGLEESVSDIAAKQTDIIKSDNDRLAKHIYMLDKLGEKESKRMKQVPLDFKAWKARLSMHPDRFTEYTAKSFELDLERKYKAQFPDRVAKLKLAGKSYREDKQYSDYRRRNSTAEKKWMDRKFKLRHDAYQEKFRYTSALFSSLSGETMMDAWNLVSASELSKPHMENYMYSAEEADAHQTQFTLLGMYLRGNDLTDFLKKTKLLSSYNWIRRALPGRKWQKRRLPALDA